MNVARWVGPVVLGAALALGGVPARAGYPELERERGAYRPPEIYTAYSAPAGVAPAGEAGPDDFAHQVESLDRARRQWQASLQAGVAGAAFYTPSAEALERLGAAGDDPEAAAAAVAGEFSLETLETLAWLRNPGIRAAQAALRGVLERYTQASSLDEVLRQYSAFTEALMPGVGPMQGREPIPKRFPFPGVLALKGEVVTQEVRAQVEVLEIARRAAVTGIRKASWNLGFVHRARGITGETLELLRRLEAVATTRYETGKPSFQDVIKVRIQRATLEEDLTTLVEQQHTLEAKIREVLSLPAGAAVGAPAPRDPETRVPELGPLYLLAAERRQELRRMRAALGKLERMIEMAETMILPGYGLGLSWYADEAVTQVGTFRAREPFSETIAASTGAGLPKAPWYGSNDAYLRESRQKLAALREELRRAEDATSFGVREAWFALDQAAREERLYAGSLVDLSQAALEVSTRGYEAGRVMFADVIASYGSWLRAKLGLERRRADLGVAWADLEQAVGVSPLDL